MPCQVYLWQEFKDGRPIATLELWIMPVFENGIPQHVKENPLAKPRPRIYIQIRDMHTKPKYRRTGIMDRLLIMALQDRRVEWFETSWNDSTEEGRSFLLHRGFKREDDKLVFRPPEEPCQN
jgi:GNAT superfamily N-acetyltransferase